MIAPVIAHLRGRLKEPSCWAGISAAIAVTATQIPEWHRPLYAVSGLCATAAILVKSGGSMDKPEDRP